MYPKSLPHSNSKQSTVNPTIPCISLPLSSNRDWTENTHSALHQWTCTCCPWKADSKVPHCYLFLSHRISLAHHKAHRKPSRVNAPSALSSINSTQMTFTGSLSMVINKHISPVRAINLICGSQVVQDTLNLEPRFIILCLHLESQTKSQIPW